MGLLARLRWQARKETTGVLNRAAKARYLDGQELVAGPNARYVGAIYLLGYVAEMLLKVALFRFWGWRRQTIDLRMIRGHASWAGRNMHDIEGLALLLIEERKLGGDPLDPAFAGQLRREARSLKANWQETLRYCSRAANKSELEEVRRSVDWMLKNAGTL